MRHIFGEYMFARLRSYLNRNGIESGVMIKEVTPLTEAPIKNGPSDLEVKEIAKKLDQYGLEISNFNIHGKNGVYRVLTKSEEVEVQAIFKFENNKMEFDFFPTRESIWGNNRRGVCCALGTRNSEAKPGDMIGNLTGARASFGGQMSTN